MVEPVSITCGILYAGLGNVLWNAAVSGVIGNRADALACRVGRSLHGRLLLRRGQSENHDIAMGLRQAQLKATDVVIESWARRLSENRPVAFLAGVRHGLKEAKKQVDDLAWDAEIEAAMFASYQQAFREPQDDDDPNADMARLAEQTTQAAWDEVMAWAGGAHADEMLKPRFFGKMPHIVGFHDAWCAEVAEVLKDNPRFNDIFVAGKLVEIADVMISGQDVLARLEADTAGAREQIENIILLIQEFRKENASAHERTQILVGVEMKKQRQENEALKNALLQIREFVSEVAFSSERVESNSLRREF